MAALVSQAASIQWKTGTGVKGANEDGSFATANAASGTLNMYVWLVAAETYATLNAESVWATYGSALDTADGTKTAFGGSLGGTVETADLNYVGGQNTPYYAAVIITLDADKDGAADFYIANAAESLINGAGQGVNVNNLAKYEGGITSGTAISGWTAVAVPEPTSALMLLVGLAGLALKRKVA